MSKSKSSNAEHNLIFAGLGLQLGIIAKDKVIRAFTEWLFDKTKPLGEILVHQKAITPEQRKALESAVEAHIQQEGSEQKALASLNHVKDLESDLDHLADNDLNQSLDGAVTKRKLLGLDVLFSQSHDSESSSTNKKGSFSGSESKQTDRFERQHFLDSGNLGEVFFAKDTELNRTVVTKYIRPEMSGDSLKQALFHLEGEVTGALEHPNVVPVYGLGKDTKGRLYYAMRYIRGKKLSGVIAEYHRKKAGLKQEALTGLLQNFQAVCLAIEYAHSKGVLHCDIKPDNIMIGDYGEVFVVDWGLVVVCGDVKGSSEIKMEPLDPGSIPPYKPSELASSGLHEQQGGSRRGVGGTRAYMAPEQFTASEDGDIDISLVTPKADIYALGSTLYHILTGKAPHLPKEGVKESFDAFYFRIITGMIPAPREKDASIPKLLEQIVLKAMQVEPGDRYASARELAEDIKRYVSDEPVHAYQESGLEKARRWVRKNRALVGAAMVMLLLLALGGFGYGVVTMGYNEKLRISEKAARDQRDIAQDNEELAIESEKLVNQQFYINKIQRAQSELNQGELIIAKDQLTSAPFYQRHWEHHFLNSLMNLNQTTLRGHTHIINSVAFSPDGKKIVSGSQDNTLKLWDASTGMEILSLKGHSNVVTSVAFSPDGKRIVSGSWDNTLKIWDASTGMEILTLAGHTRSVTSVAFSPDGKKIVSGSQDTILKLWDASTGMEILSLKGHSHDIYSVAFSPDGKKIVSGGPVNPLKVWDVSTGMEILSLKGNGGTVTRVAFSPDGKRIVSGNSDDTLKLWDASTGMEILTLIGHTNIVNSVAFSPDGKEIVSGSEDNTLKLWDASTGMEILTLNGHTGSVRSVSFSPDGKRIVSGGEDRTLKLWEPSIGMDIMTLDGHTEGVTSVAFSPDGKKIVSGSQDNIIKVWDASTGMGIFSLKGHSDRASSVVFSPDGKKIVSGSWDSTLKLWDASAGMEIITLKSAGLVTSVAFSPDGKKIVSGNSNKTIQLWDATTGIEILTLAGHSHFVRCVAFSPDGKKIVSGSEDNTLKLWDASTGMEILSLIGHTNLVNSVACSPDGKKIMSGSEDNTLKIWDASTGMEILTLTGHIGRVYSVAFSPDGKRIVSGCADNSFKVWDSSSGMEIISLKGHKNGISSVSFSPDGGKIVSGSWDSTLKVWDASTGMENLTLKGHEAGVSSVYFSPDGKKIVGENIDKSIKIWDSKTGKELKTHTGHTGFVTSVSFSSDGKRLLSSSSGFVYNSDRVMVGGIGLIGGGGLGGGLGGDLGLRTAKVPEDKNIKIWNAETGKILKSLSGHSKGVSSACFSPDGKKVASGSEDKIIKLWDAYTGLEILSLKGHSNVISSVAFSPDGKKIVSGSWDSTLKVWDASTGMENLTLKGHEDGVSSVAFSPDGKRIVSGSEYNSFKVWDASTGIEIPLSQLADDYSSASKPQISPDKQWSLEIDGGNVVLINNKLREERIAMDKKKLARWAKPDPKWHFSQATDSENNNQWFAATFHLRKLLEIEPNQEDIKKRLKVAESKTKEN